MPRRAACALVAFASVAGTVACASPTGPKSCGTLAACQADATRRFGHPLLVPVGDTYVQGALDRGVVGLEFRDPSAGPFSVFAGKPGSNHASCPGQVLQAPAARTFCGGRTIDALRAQFVSGQLLYTVDVPAPRSSASSLSPADEALLERVVGALS